MILELLKIPLVIITDFELLMAIDAIFVHDLIRWDRL